MSQHQRQTSQSSAPTRSLRPEARPQAFGGQGNAFLAQQVAQAQASDLAPAQVPIPRPRPERLTPEQRFHNRFDAQASREIDPSEPRWKRMSEGQAEQLAAVPEEERPGSGTLGYSTTINGETWQWDAHAEHPATPLRASQLMGDGNQAFSRAFETANPDHEDRTDVTVLNPDGTTSVLGANADGMVELPTEGHGFRTHNRNDVRVNGQAQPDQWGSAESVARTMNIMSDYATMFEGSSLSIGDLSTDTGNSPRLFTGRTTRHASHYDGTQVDLQYPDGTGSTNRMRDEGDNLFRMNSLLKISEGHGMDNFHAATNLRGDLFPSDPDHVHHSRPHNNHLHMGRGTGRH